MARPSIRRLLWVLCLVTAPLAGSDDGIRFADVTDRAELRAPLDGIMAHAAAWGDIDGDGDLDVFVGGFADRPDKDYVPASGPVPNRLFRNMGTGRFERIVNPAVERYGRTTGAVFVDLDNDGMLDLYVLSNTRTSRLAPGPQRDAQLRQSAVFRNDRGTFVDVSAASGRCVTMAGAARSVGVLDYDADGALDLLILEDRFGSSPPASRLCRNLGGFRFGDMTSDAGLPNDLFGFGLAIADLNEDGRPDIFATDSNRLFISAGQGRYVEPAGPKSALAWTPMDSEDWPAGAAFADLNRDGRADLVVGIHHEHARNRVYLNQGNERGTPVFRDVSGDVGIPSQLSTKSPHIEVKDFDNDGWPDLYFSAAWLDANGEISPLLFRNLGVRRGLPRFEPIKQISAGRPNVYFPAGPSGDYDGDGRIDLFLANWFRGNYSRLLHNVSGENGWLDVRVRGRAMNRMGIGAKVSVYRGAALGGGLLGVQEIGTGYGFGSGQAAVAHFGVGKEQIVDVEVIFPDGARKVVKSVQSGRGITVDGP